jgi:glutathione peroxidase|eukprot:CAMPEP_0174285948 /NCGR_PEP_ID=MMETSP0809-20121228/10079_1 /TAXON_ID=73025 ORGANISM="Eutreptiella gymnastica-like, Strain CCMP1594" /NCGR_SAMPLE_ID=MMETSP0809 /ASSEMBLY_ACC=CAM_ASM_000658 /LENGTH=164 /DNA_ID=CAMNT_0015381841 /DNA_START=106 /DNA_END=600 /DNA_ORIENTATION=+
MTSAHDFVVKDASGQDVKISDYKGQVLLMVNVASKCGFTPQYTGLQALQDKYKDRPFSVMAFPCNQFGGQEPGTNDEVCQFAKNKFSVTFPIMDKIEVNGSNSSPLWEYMKKEQTGIMYTKGIKWNFTKFLVDQEGKVLARYSSISTPESIAKDIDGLLMGTTR